MRSPEVSTTSAGTPTSPLCILLQDLWIPRRQLRSSSAVLYLPTKWRFGFFALLAEQSSVAGRRLAALKAARASIAATIQGLSGIQSTDKSGQVSIEWKSLVSALNEPRGEVDQRDCCYDSWREHCRSRCFIDFIHALNMSPVEWEDAVLWTGHTAPTVLQVLNARNGLDVSPSSEDCARRVVRGLDLRSAAP